MKWKGYLHVHLGSNLGEAFLEVTEAFYHALEQQLPESESLRGVLFQVHKTKGGPKGRYIVQVLERRLQDDEMPKEKDPYGTLAYLWSCKRPAGEGGAA